MCCLFCELVDQKEKHKDFEGQWLESSTYWMIVLNKYPLSKGHLLLILKEHAHYFDISENALKELHYCLKQINFYLSKLDPKPQPVSIMNIIALNDNIKFHNEKDEPHFHFHIIPRYEYTELEQKHYYDFYGDLATDKVVYGHWWLAHRELIMNRRKNHLELKKELEEMVTTAYNQMKS